MSTGRVEAFSDGVIAILITIMVLELKVPHGETFAALAPLVGVFMSYVLSFIYLGIYWNNHHHMFQTLETVTGPMLWANLHLLFWLSLIPVTTAWMGESPGASAPAALYGGVLLLSALAYVVLQQVIIASQGPGSVLRRAIGRDRKGRLSPVLYLAGVVLAFVSPALSELVYAVVACIWLVPDRRIERLIDSR